MAAPGCIALIFDMDNTVLGSHIDFAAIRRELIAILHAAAATSDSEQALKSRAIAELVALGAAHDRAHGTDLVPRMWEIIEEYEAAGLHDAAALDGAPEVLRALRDRGYRLAILTNNGRRAALAALGSCGLSECVHTVVARDDVAALKPAGDGAAEALRRLGPVDRAYVVGDSWIDGAAAAAVGARFISYRRAPEDLRPRGIEPWRVIAHLQELLAPEFFI
jgi:phosphoglycolate phosphatase